MNDELVVVNRPKSIVSETIRTLRTNLQFSFMDKCKVVMITSSMAGEGKSFISSNLACAFAMNDNKVLLVDCDLRKGRQYGVFGLDPDSGLSNLLLDDLSNYKKYIVKTDVENLSVLPNGIVPPNPSELLGSEKTRELFDDLRKKYDIIILDCPPLNAITDSLVLTSLADIAVIVSAYKKTPLDLLEMSKKSLESTKIKIAGIVINKMEKDMNGYYYSSSYYK